MDKDKFVDLLNEDLETEYQSIVQYIQHIATISGAEWFSTIEELRKHVEQEVQHALTLADQVDFLGGTPSVKVPPVQGETDSRKALEADLRLETRQLERYRERVQQAQELGLRDVEEALRPLLEQTQDHVHDLKTVLEN